jgi:hypothetical protein
MVGLQSLIDWLMGWSINKLIGGSSDNWLLHVDHFMVYCAFPFSHDPSSNSRLQVKFSTVLKMGPLDSHFASWHEVIYDDILPLLKWHGHKGDMGLFVTLHGIFCHKCYIYHCHIIFILYRSVDEKIFANPPFSFSGMWLSHVWSINLLS